MIKKWYERVLVISIAMILAVFIGCVAFQNAITPSWIDQTAFDYIRDVNYSDDIPRFWWTSLADAEVVEKLLNFSHDQKQIVLDRAKDDDKTWFAVVKNQHNENIKNSLEFREQVFTPNGTIGLIAAAGMGTLIGKLGLSKPSDKKVIEELKNNNNKNKNLPA